MDPRNHLPGHMVDPSTPEEWRYSNVQNGKSQQYTQTNSPIYSKPEDRGSMSVPIHNTVTPATLQDHNLIEEQ
jgi:hypothetical protein